MKKRILTAVLCAAMLLSLAACSSVSKETEEAVKDIAQEAVDQLASAADADNSYVRMVKNGSPNSYPDISYDEAFGSFFAYPTWKYYQGEKHNEEQGTYTTVDVVEFTGHCTYQDVEVKALIQFVVNENEGTFTAEYLSFNEVPQNMLVLYAVIEKAFESYREDHPAQSSAVASNPAPAKTEPADPAPSYQQSGITLDDIAYTVIGYMNAYVSDLNQGYYDSLRYYVEPGSKLETDLKKFVETSPLTESLEDYEVEDVTGAGNSAYRVTTVETYGIANYQTGNSSTVVQRCVYTVREQGGELWVSGYAEPVQQLAKY